MAAIKVRFEDQHSTGQRSVKVGWSWTLFFFALFAGIPLFMRGLFFRGLIFLAVWFLNVSVVFAVIPDQQKLAVLATLNAVELALVIWIAARGNQITARRLLRRGWSIADPGSTAAQYGAMRWGLHLPAARREPSLLENRGPSTSHWPLAADRHSPQVSFGEQPPQGLRSDRPMLDPSDRRPRPQRSESSLVTVLGALGSIAALGVVGVKIWSYVEKSTPQSTQPSIQSEEGFPTCDGPTARELIENALKENALSLNLKLYDLTDIRQVSFDDKKPERRCTASAALNSGQTSISYRIWISTDKMYLIEILGL